MMTNDEDWVPTEEDVRYYSRTWFTESDMDRFLARVRRDAWAEGCRAAEQYYKRTVVGIPGLDPIPAPVNPHRETGDRT